jgi:hypothetical protein
VGILTETPGLYARLDALANLAFFAKLYGVDDIEGQVAKYLKMLGFWERRIFHKLRSITIKNFNEQFKDIFDGHGQVPTNGLINTQRFALSAILAYQLALLYRSEHDMDLRVGLKPFLKAA